MNRSPITHEGYKKIEAAIRHIISKERPQNIKDIEVALSYGDLKENAEYHAAKEKQAMLDAKLNQLNNMLAESEITVISENPSGKIAFGAKVTYEDLDSGKISSYQIVGKHEADIAQNKISITSPIGKFLMGKEEGEELTIKIPKGSVNIEIQSVSYS